MTELALCATSGPELRSAWIEAELTVEPDNTAA